MFSLCLRALRALGSTVCVLLLTMGLTAPTHGMDTTWVCDSSNDAIYRMVDLNGDGTIDPTHEVLVFYDDTSPGPDLSTPLHLLRLGSSLLVADAGTVDAILRLTDLNGDGDANDAGEVVAYYDDSATGPDLATANGMSHAPGGAVLVSDDGSTVRAILRLIDTNNDGDAGDDGEVSIYYDQSALSPSPVMSDPEAVAAASSGAVYVADSALGRVLRLADLNGDGDALDAAEATIFYEGSVPALLTDIDAVQLDGDVVIAVDEDNGTVLRLTDSNGDGDALDPGEAMVWIDGATTAVAHDPNDVIVIGDGKLLIADGMQDALFLAEDVDGNGMIEAAETTPYFDDAGALLATPSGVAFEAAPPTSSPPQISSVTPGAGPLAGGTPVTLTGAALLEVFSVKFGVVDATFNVVDDSTIEAVAPVAALSGLVDVTVESPHGAAVAVNAFEYVAPATLTISTVDPPYGATVGGDAIALFGAGWDIADPLAVQIGALPAQITLVTDTMILVQSPPHPRGVVDVDLTDGSATVSAIGAFDYRVRFLRGDSNMNGNVDLGDAITQLGYLYIAGAPTPTCLSAFDTNNDDVVDLGDTITLLTYLFSGGPPPAPPFPRIGVDVTAAPGCDDYNPSVP